MKHEITRHRHEVRRWNVRIAEKSYLTPHMLRLVFEGDDLAHFASLGADDHVKLFVGEPGPDGRAEMRDYTPRAFDNAARTLTVDFAVHEAGPATRWALDAEVGDPALLAGPRGSTVVPADFDWMLLVADETGLPALGRRLEELPAGSKVFALALVTGADEEQAFATRAELALRWVHRPADAAADPAPALAAVEAIELPAGDGFVWIAAEAKVARAVRDRFLDAGHPRDWMKASGYWLKGEADAHDKM